MRKGQKRQVENLVCQMRAAHEQIKKCIERDCIPQAAALLGDCQNGGIAIGTLIENTEGQGHPTVSLLEEYCELIYGIYQNLEKGIHEINAKKSEELLQEKLNIIENSIKNGISIKKEVVFLPYKASMWDSLESVWKAAEEDEGCDAYVIPIPYFDKNPDMSFGEMHYEGDQYPDYVPITYYGDYDLQDRRPDAIYIHNPYDECNLVTSVEPFYFSSNLKNLTEELIYIPYFVLAEVRPDEDERIEGMKNFVLMPAVFNAHKVIVQSEDMRQVYIKVLLDSTNNHSETARKYWENKILGLGSPKFDKVANTKKEELHVPEEWLKIIQKPDGSRKKIVFYNTSITALLQHNEKMFEKMESVFRLFRKYQDEIVLLWRPHPLIWATLKSIRPQLWAEYEKLVRKYQEEGWGIYDDTTDMDRAIVISDAYYGDASSLVQLYQKTGKPIMVQNVEFGV